MRITSVAGTGRRRTAITLEAEKEEDLQDFQSALLGHSWVRLNEHDELEISPAHNNPPILFDEDVDPIYDGKPATIRQLKDYEHDSDHVSIYVQHLSGYSGKYLSGCYGHDKILKATVMRFNGFEVLRTKRGRDGQIWEIWYLPGSWAAEGELRGKKTDQILKWLREVIRPGTIDTSGKKWGLVLDD